MAPSDAGHRLPYLPALDGLRGTAVVVVVAFHAHWLTGGYLGVDLFFVLSGFLITRLLLNEYSNTRRIDLIQFWKRRARRLLPAMLVVVVCAAALERARSRLDGATGGRRDVIGALTYSANWLRLNGEAGYWAQFDRPAVLDHVWSLAIEEQFYLAWPLLLWGLLRLVRSDLARVIILALASGGLAWWALHLFSTTSDASRVYMGTDTRAVALLLGATVAAVAHWRPLALRSLVVQVVAVPALIGLAILTVRMRGDAVATYEGGLIAYSVAGAIVVAAGALEQPRGIFRIFTISPLQWLGLRSYGIYLWHWPIMVALRVAGAPASPLSRRVIAVAITLVVAEFSYRVIEQPIRTKGLRAFHQPARTVVLGLAAVALALGSVFAPVLRVSTIEAISLPITDPTPEAQPSDSTFVVRALPDGRSPRIMFVGDSVGHNLANQAEAEHERLGIEVKNASVDGCPLSDAPLSRRVDASSLVLVFGAECSEAVRSYRDTAQRTQPDVVIMQFGASFLNENEITPGEWHKPCSTEFDDWFEDQLRKSIDALSSTGATVYWATPGYYRGEVDDRTTAWDDQVDCLNASARQVAAESNGVMAVVDLGAWTCPTRECTLERDGFVLRPDGFHYTPQSASLANIWMLSQIFDPLPWLRAA